MSAYLFHESSWRRLARTSPPPRARPVKTPNTTPRANGRAARSSCFPQSASGFTRLPFTPFPAAALHIGDRRTSYPPCVSRKEMFLPVASAGDQPSQAKPSVCLKATTRACTERGFVPRRALQNNQTSSLPKLVTVTRRRLACCRGSPLRSASRRGPLLPLGRTSLSEVGCAIILRRTSRRTFS